MKETEPMQCIYTYVGPQKVAERSRHAFQGTLVACADDVLRWIGPPGRALVGSGEVIVTFVIDETRALLIADRRSEHVACAAGRPVWSAGEMTFRLAGNSVVATQVTNQSTGYCPEPESWPVVNSSLKAAGIEAPAAFDPVFIFRYCEGCGTTNIIKDNFFTCDVCGAALPTEWNFDASEPTRATGLFAECSQVAAPGGHQ